VREVSSLTCLDKTKLFAACEEFNPTNFLHLAAQAGVRYSLENPSAYIDSNITGFLNVLEYCRHRKGAVPLTYASSSSVYGLNTKMPFSIDDRTDQQVRRVRCSRW
jgi:UDP-glucuronate 4-epimerase